MTLLDIFVSRVQYDDNNGALPFDLLPKFTKQTNVVRAAYALPGDGAITAGFTKSRVEERQRGLRRGLHRRQRPRRHPARQEGLRQGVLPQVRDRDGKRLCRHGRADRAGRPRRGPDLRAAVPGHAAARLQDRVDGVADADGDGHRTGVPAGQDGHRSTSDSSTRT